MWFSAQHVILGKAPQISYLKFIDMWTVGAFERPLLGQVSNLFLEVSVSQMENHGFRCHLEQYIVISRIVL